MGILEILLGGGTGWVFSGAGHGEGPILTIDVIKALLRLLPDLKAAHGVIGDSQYEPSIK